MESLIELKQKNGNSISVSNGDYNCNFKQTQINMGDTIELKSCFIDTVNNNESKIVIPKGITEMNLSIGMYLIDQPSPHGKASVIKQYCTNYPSDGGSPEGKITFSSNETQVDNAFPNGNLYVLCSKDAGNPSGGSAINVNVTSFLMKDTHGARMFPNKNKECYLRYKTPDGAEHTAHFTISSKTWKKKGGASTSTGVANGTILTVDASWFEYANFSLPLTVVKDAYTVNGQPNNFRVDNTQKISSQGTAEKIMNDSAWAYDNNHYKNAETTDANFNPWYFNINIPLVEDTSYDPLDFARYLTRELNKSTNKQGIIPSGQLVNQLSFQSKTQLKARGNSNTLPNQTNKNPFWVSNNSGSILEYTDNLINNFIYGASSIDIGFDQSTNLFSIDVMHSSIYDGNNKAIVPIPTLGGDKILNKIGGIFFHSCDQLDIWIKQMKFNPNIFVNETMKVDEGYPDFESGGKLTLPTFPTLQDGVNMTGEAIYSDIFVPKGSEPSSSTGNPPVVTQLLTYDEAYVSQASKPALANYSQKYGVITNNVESIYAQTPFPVQDDNFSQYSPYYQIELSGGLFYDKISNGVPSNKICAIINKYYNTNSYTVGDGSMGVIYEHTDQEPLILTNIGVRILDENGNLLDDTTINDNNTVFLSIARAKPNE